MANTENKMCSGCNKSFSLDATDLGFYKKMSVWLFHIAIQKLDIAKRQSKINRSETNLIYEF